MQKLIIIMLIAVISANCQTIERFCAYFGRQASPRSEAMGRGMVAVGDGVFSVTQNPALITSINGIEAVYSNSFEHYLFGDEGKYNNFGVGYNYGNLIYGAFLVKQFSQDIELNANHSFSSIYRDYNISLAGKYPLFSATELSGGVNFNIVRDEFDENNKTIRKNSLSTDLGFNICTQTDDFTKYNLSASLTNISASKYGDQNYPGDNCELPQIARLGLSSDFISDIPEYSLDNLLFLKAILTCQYQFVLNDDVRDGYSLGSEFQFMEILSVRAGYYEENLSESGNEQYKEFTYGFGIQVPLAKKTNNKIPLNISFDLTNLPQPRINHNDNDLENFNSYAFKANYLL